ncbi:hypothetical protein I4U23_031238 [Adineta vaga]|nr:hypothetical protein I4U23_031238 [Adineta vaga]
MEKKSSSSHHSASTFSDIDTLRRQLDAIERYEKQNQSENSRLDEIKKQCDVLQKESIEKLSAISQKQVDAQEHLQFVLKRTKEISQMMKALQDSESVDVCFLMDCTNSMQKYINEVKDRIFETVKLLKSRFPHLNIRLAFVGYRDLNLPEEKQFSILDFTDEETFHSFVSMVKCQFGGDACEDVLGGLEKVTNLQWNQPVRILIHVADCPSHGRRYHNLSENKDHYLSHDADGSIGQSYIEKFIELDIKYFFGRLTSHTDKMIELFSQYAQKRTTIEQINLKNFENLLPFIVDSISRSISKTASSLLKSHSIVDENVHNTKNSISSKTSNHSRVSFDSQEPDWLSIAPKKVQVIKYECNNELRCDEIIQSSNIKIAEKPFSEGAMRLAYFGLMQNKDKWDKVVLKKYKRINNDLNIKEKYLQLLDCQTIAEHLAQEFNKSSVLRDPTVSIKKIKFIMTKLVFDPLNEGKTHYFTIERFIDGAYKKFSNNAGYVNQDNPALTLQAFSHWTYERTNGNMMVVDLQGMDIGDDQTYLLTDPCIHSTDLLRFGKTNLGKPGIKRFFQTHVCNAICHALKLKMHEIQSESKTKVSSKHDSHSSEPKLSSKQDSHLSEVKASLKQNSHFSEPKVSSKLDSQFIEAKVLSRQDSCSAEAKASLKQNSHFSEPKVLSKQDSYLNETKVPSKLDLQLSEAKASLKRDSYLSEKKASTINGSMSTKH